MGRPRILGDCPECGGRLLVRQTNRRQWCIVRYVECGVCGRRFRLVTSSGGSATGSAPPVGGVLAARD